MPAFNAAAVHTHLFDVANPFVSAAGFSFDDLHEPADVPRAVERWKFNNLWSGRILHEWYWETSRTAGRSERTGGIYVPANNAS
jgi:hypothetical protein